MRNTIWCGVTCLRRPVRPGCIILICWLGKHVENIVKLCANKKNPLKRNFIKTKDAANPFFTQCRRAHNGCYISHRLVTLNAK